MRNNKGQFGKGFSGNPSGRYLKRAELGDLSKAELRVRLWKVVKMTHAELKALADDPSAQALDKLLASIVCASVAMGCERRAEWIYTRLIGKPQEIAEQEDDQGDEQLEEISVKKALKVLQEKDYATQPALPGKVEDL